MEAFPTELIYDAATDEAALEQLSGLLTTYIGARSGVIHWREIGSEEEYASFSGYYSDEDMAAYSRDFSDADLWAKAISYDAEANRAVNLAGLVVDRTYENSRIYNDWIRAMGDDTFHCLGATVRIAGIEGQLGFHRGRHQPAFDQASTARLDRVLGHITRMIAIKTRLSIAERKAAAVSTTLDVLGDGLFTVDATARLLSCNAAGEAILQRGRELRLQRGRLISASPEVQKKLMEAVHKAASAASPEPSTFRQPRAQGGHFVLTVIGTPSWGSRSLTICVTAPNASDPTLCSRLRSLYDLAQAEAEVAVRVAAGASVSELAEERGTSVATVRTQVKAVALKLGCSRQVEIAAIVNGMLRLRSC